MPPGGTRKFWRCVVDEHLVEALPGDFGVEARAVVPSGRIPSIASRLRRKSSLVGLKTTKWRPAAGCCSETVAFAGRHVQKNGLSSVLKSARWGTAVPFG